MYYRFVLIIFFLLAYQCSFAQSIDFSGVWIGILRQEAGGLNDIYEFSIILDQDKNGNLTGTSLIRIEDTKEYAVISLIGKATLQGIVIQEIRVIEQSIRTHAYWCIKNYTLRYNPTRESLSGPWSAKQTCAPGTMELIRPKKVSSLPNKPKNKPISNGAKVTKEIAKEDVNSASLIAKEEKKTPVSDTLVLPVGYLNMAGLKAEIKKNKLVVGKKIILENVYFQQSSTNLIENSQKNLLQVVDFLNENPSIKIQISGHTDNVGKEHSNKHLSKLRAIAVMNFLIDEGIEASRLSAEGYGSAFPICPNDSEKNKKRNRRVEFEIKK
jgi:outer membrane protein OmpA-like peptidoglycan-associated protein